MNADDLYECVKAINNAYRTASMNRKYYGYRLSRVKLLNVGLEILVAVGTSSAIGAWWIWRSSSAGETAWAILAAAATLLAILKPILKLSDQVERHTKLFVGHGDVYYDLKLIASDLARAKNYTDEIDKNFRRTVERIKELAPEDDPKINDRLRRKSYEEVKREIPVESLWWPR
jgi:hypothetical protein